MIDSLRGGRLPGAFLGQPAANRERIAQLVSAVSVFGAANDAWLSELDLNPVIAGPETAVAADWLMIGA